MKLFRIDWWPGHPPTIEKNRVMCSDCRFHSAAVAGWQWDRCHHPEADYGSIIRNDQRLKCYDARRSAAQCGLEAKWFEAKTAKARDAG